MTKSIKISDENYQKICKLAVKERRTKKAIIDLAVEKYFKKSE